MAIPSGLVGVETAPFVHEVDARWLMAYAAGLGDHNPRYLDTTSPAGIVGHPLFPVCPEWPVILAGRDAAFQQGVSVDELRRGVHANHDCVVHRPIRPGDRLTTVGTVAAVESRPPGAFLLTKLETTDAAGLPVATTWQGGLYLGVAVDGPDRQLDEPPSPLPAVGAAADTADSSWATTTVPISAGAAHVYTECARIWNPIHTDLAVAYAAGLPGLILHGTATHALGVTEVVNRYAGGEPTRVRRIVGRFGAMVAMPSTITIATRLQEETAGDGGQVVALSVLNEDGRPAVRDGLVVIGPESENAP